MFYINDDKKKEKKLRKKYFNIKFIIIYLLEMME